MLIVGLTGSIGMGKTKAANMFRTMGLPVFDSDAFVHELMETNTKVISLIRRVFPEAVNSVGINRRVLGQIVFKNRDALQNLEAILHPLVRMRQAKFLRSAKLRFSKIAVLDVPLLYESRTDEKCDIVIVMTAPRFIQKQRVMARSGMTEERFCSILMNQLSDQEKRKRADYVVQTGGCIHNTHTALKQIIYEIKYFPSKKWCPGW